MEGEREKGREGKMERKRQSVPRHVCGGQRAPP